MKNISLMESICLRDIVSNVELIFERLQRRELDNFIKVFFHIISMKLGCVLLILTILVVPVNAELLISCNEDIDCALVSENTCFKGFCQSSNVKPFLGLNDFMLKENIYIDNYLLISNMALITRIIELSITDDGGAFTSFF